MLLRPSQQLADLLGTFRAGDAIGKQAELTGAHGQPVRQALATGMAHAHFGVLTNQWMRRQARRRHARQHLLQAGIGQTLARPDQLGEKGFAMGRQFHLGRFVSPSVPASHRIPIPISTYGCLY